MRLSFEWILFGFYALIGPGASALLALGILKGHKRMSLLSRPGFSLPEPVPKATVLVPVKDEALQIGSCIESVLQLDYPNPQIVVVDDRSSDGTSAVIDELVEQHRPRIEAIHLRDNELPVGWSGKCHALQVGVRRATGDWLLFIDSDVTISSDALRATIALAEWKRYDLVSLLPRLEARTFWERLLIPLCGTAIGAMYLLPMTNYNELP